MQQKKLVFENGSVFYGTGFGADVQRICEVVFNTSMVGYQEIFSDCSYCGQFVCMTYPLIGNYGMAEEDYESRQPHIGGMIVREYNDSTANFRAVKTLGEEMEECGIPGIQGVDTRKITRMIRSTGSMQALLCNADFSDEEAKTLLQNNQPPTNQVQQVSTRKRWHMRTANAGFSVVTIDYGIKLGILHSLAALGCNLTVLPYNTTAEEVLRLAPDGLLLSNGPGDPQNVPEGIALVQQLQGKLPIMGVCLGHQLIALANGCKTYKLLFGHRGGNHPVQCLTTGQIEMTSQNHSFAVEAESVKNTGLEVTHVNLLDNTVEGLANKKKMLFSVQYHPESNPGPQDSAYLFQQFVNTMQRFKEAGVR
ncbi:MAG: glutamine-hydrolyzing carbamoyl-phosphate synthase small subunit [Oscillospiraceae bacterium]